MEDYLKRIVALLVYVGAFLAIPFLAKRLSGALGTLMGMVNDRSKGIIDRPRNRLKKFAQERRQGRRQALRNRFMGQAMATPKPRTLNPLKKEGWKEGWRARKRLRAEGIFAAKRFKAGGQFFDKEKPFTQTDEERAEAEAAAGEEMPGTPLPIADRLKAWREERGVTRRVVDRVRERRREINAQVGQVVGKTMGEEIKTTLGQAETAIFEKDLMELEGVVLNTEELVNVRQAAVNKLVKSGMVKPVRAILERAYELSLTNASDPLVTIVQNVKNSNELYSAFKETAPDLAKSAFDEQNKLRAQPQARFLVTSSIDNCTQWDISTWKTLIDLPKNNPGYTEEIEIGGVKRMMNARQIRDYVLKNQGDSILQSPQAKRKTKQDILELIKTSLENGEAEGDQSSTSEEEN